MKHIANFGTKACAFFICLFLFASCNKKSASAEKAGSSQTDTGFRVIAFEPDGELPNEVKFPSIYIQFSEPVVALQELGTPSSQSDVFKIEPELKGVFRWYGTSLLSFESEDEIIPQREYVITVNKNLKSKDGEKISGKTEFSFKTEELKMMSVVPGYNDIKDGKYIDKEDVPLQAASSIAVFFSYPVNTKVITPYISVTDEAGKEYTFSTSPIENENAVLLKVKEGFPQNSDINITLKKGAKSEKEYLGTSEDVIETFHTLKNFELDYSLTNSHSYGKYTNPVYLYYSHPLAESNTDVLVKNLKTSPAMAITKDNIEISGSRLIIYGLPVTFEQTYSMTIPDGITDIYGRKIAASEQLEITVPAALSYASFKDYGSGILEAQFPPKIAFEYQNIDSDSWYSVNGNKFDISPTEDQKNKRIIRTVDLAPYLKKIADRYYGFADFYAYLEVKDPWSDTYSTYGRDNNQLIQVTDLGVTVRYAFNKIVVMVTSLETGAPVKDAQVSASFIDYRDGLNSALNYTGKLLGSGVTNENGLAVIKVADGRYNQLKNNNNELYLDVKKDHDRVAFRANLTSIWRYDIVSASSPENAEKVEMRTFVFTDRGLYKPGETITFRGIDRDQKLGKLYTYTGPYTISITENRWKGKELVSFTGKTTSSGGFWHKYQLPQDLEPGDYVIKYSRSTSSKNTSTQYTNFTVAYFERLRFSASASIPNVIYTRGDRVDAQVSAEYLGGGSMSGSYYRASWFTEPIGFRPEGKQFDGYRFGPIQGYDYRSYIGSEEGILDTSGKASISSKTGSERLKGMAYQYRTEISVTDSGDQEITATAFATVHPAQYYIGLSSPDKIKGYPKKGTKLTFNFLLATPEGTTPSKDNFPSKKTDQQITVELLREEWKAAQQMGYNGTINTNWVKEMVTDSIQTVPLAESGSFTVTPQKGGAYVVRLSAKDKKSNEVITERRMYVTGSDWYYYGEDSEELKLLSDKDEYKIGDTANIMLQSPLEKGKYLLTIEREGIFSEEILDINEPVTVLEVPIKEDYLPVVYVAISSFSKRTGEPVQDYDSPDFNKPKAYFGVTALHINPEAASFDIKVASDKTTYQPGEKATITLTATKDGKPLSGAELTLMAVDRGVIDLINYHVPDPVSFFYNEYHFPLCTYGGDSRSLLIDPVVYESKNLFGGDADDESDEKMQERKNFDATAVFKPFLQTDDSGKATCTFTWPDNLTAYRITAIGAKDAHFSISENEISVANPISVRDVLPRKLRVGDNSEAGVVISNLQDTAQSVTVSLAIYDGIEKTGKPAEENGYIKQPGHISNAGKTEQTISVPANSTLPLMFPIKATESGFATLEFTVKSTLVNERILKPLEIEKQYVFETVTTVGQTATGNSKKASNQDDNTAKETIIIPKSADGKGNLSVTLDPSRLGVLKEAVNYLFHYPYGCMEQRSAAILPLVYFGDYIKVFGLDSEVSKPIKVIEKELKDWGKVQKSDGGFPYWPNGNYASFPVSLRIGEILAAAKDAGIKVPSSINIDNLAMYITSELKEHYTLSLHPYAYTYANYVLVRLGYSIPMERINQIVESESSDITELCYAGLMYLELGQKEKANEVAKQIRRYTRPTTRGIDLTTRKGYWSSWFYFSGETEAYSLALKFFSKLDNNDDINGRLVYQLLELQKAGNGYWRSTSTTAKVLDALNTYIKAYNLEDTNFTAEALISGKQIAKTHFKGVAALPEEKILKFSDEPLKSLGTDKELPVVMKKDGTGTLFYTISMKYAVPPEKQFARDEGFSVFVDYIDPSTGKFISGDKLQAGKTYKAKVTVSSTRDRTFVAMRVPIPAGAEIMNAAFVTTGTKAEFAEEENDDYDYRWGLSSQTIYDSEVQYFWNLFPAGRQQVDFLFRAVRKGEYQTPATQAECMYESEIFGRNNGKVWIIE